MAHRIWTVGYEKRSQQDLIVALVEHDIELLVDVRLRPQSRKPGLSKTTLAAGLAEAEIEYEHHRVLGTPLDIRGLFRAGEYEQAREAYREYLRDVGEEELAWLQEQARARRVAMLCFEGDPRECHRRVIAEELTRLYGTEVVDIRPGS
jgi:uncharacterized protein (DUF488 family)